MSEDKKSPYPEYDGLTPAELALRMAEQRAELDKAAAVKTAIQKRYDYIRANVLPRAMEDADLTAFKPDGLDKGVRVQDELYVSVPAASREELHEWLQDHGHQSLVVETVNGSTLKAFVRDALKNGSEMPEMVKITIVPTARFY